MPETFPVVSFESFRRRLEVAAPVPLSERAARSMYAHYSELGRWNRRLSLVGAGTWDESVERHFAESLWGLDWLPETTNAHLLDVGAGGGFPGLPILAARPELRLTLVESRQRKWAFLKSAARQAGLPCRCLNARVGRFLPAGFPEDFDVILARAIRLAPEEWRALFEGAPPGRVALVWAGRSDPLLPEGLEVVDERRIEGSEERRIVKIRNNSVRAGAGER